MLTRILKYIARALGITALMETIAMVHADVQAQADRFAVLTAQIPDVVAAAVSNAEAAKDADHADDVAALKARADALEAQLDAVRQASAPPPAAPVTDPPPPVAEEG